MKITDYQDISVSTHQSGVGVWVDISVCDEGEKLTLVIDARESFKLGAFLVWSSIKQWSCDAKRSWFMFLAKRRLKKRMRFNA